MTRDDHLVVHWLDLFRHEVISTVAWEPDKTNIGAGVWWAAIVGVVSTIIYPPLRRKVGAFFKKHVAEGNAELHEKLDHLKALHESHSEKLDAIMRSNDISPNAGDKSDEILGESQKE